MNVQMSGAAAMVTGHLTPSSPIGIPPLGCVLPVCVKSGGGRREKSPVEQHERKILRCFSFLSMGAQRGTVI